MPAYSKPRTAIGVFRTPEALCRCIEALTGAVGGNASLFVLVASSAVADACAAMVEGKLPPKARARLQYVEWRQSPREETDGRPDRALCAAQVSNYGGWLDRAAADLLDKHLSDGEMVLFAPASGASEQLTAFRAMQPHVSDRVILQDLPG